MTQLEPKTQEITLESLSHRLDLIGNQLDWLCENMAGMFQFVTTMGQNGGGIRGVLRSLKEAPAITPQQQTAKQELLKEGEEIERHISRGS